MQNFSLLNHQCKCKYLFSSPYQQVSHHKSKITGNFTLSKEKKISNIFCLLPVCAEVATKKELIFLPHKN